MVINSYLQSDKTGSNSKWVNELITFFLAKWLFYGSYSSLLLDFLKIQRSHKFRKVVTKSNISKGQKLFFFLVKCSVAASMKFFYDVYVHFCQDTGEVLYGKCSCKAGVCGHCKHCAALLHQLCEYIQLDLKHAPDDKTCTDILQKWHVPSEKENRKI